MPRPRPPELVVTALAGALLVGSMVGFTRGRDDAGAPAGPRAVAIADFSFGPDALTVSVGDTVTWTNEDDATHTVTADDGQVLVSGDLGKGDFYEVTLEEAGSFEYLCKFHPNMRGAVVVEG